MKQLLKHFDPMTIFFALFTIATIVIIVSGYVTGDLGPVGTKVKSHIILQDVDDRGFTSVVFTEGTDTFALDYLDKYELDSLKATFK